MRVMVIVKATKKSEAGILPSEKLLTEMGEFNEELVKSGILLAGEGLHPSDGVGRCAAGPWSLDYGPPAGFGRPPEWPDPPWSRRARHLVRSCRRGARRGPCVDSQFGSTQGMQGMDVRESYDSAAGS
jgi:hypothetical protein